MIVKFFQHDIRQGLVKYIGRYILAVLIGCLLYTSPSPRDS